VSVSGYNYFWFNKRREPKSHFCFKISDEYKNDVSKEFDEQNIAFVLRGNDFKITCDAEFIKTNKELLRKISEFVKKNLAKVRMHILMFMIR